MTVAAVLGASPREETRYSRQCADCRRPIIE